MSRAVLPVLALILACATASAAAGGAHGHAGRGSRASARLQLVPAAPGASLADRARDDRHRHAYISARLASSSPRRRAAETSATAPEASAFAMPLTSGAYTGTGQYFVRLRVGTPAQPFVLVADTGSDLTWVKCRGASASASTTPAASPRVFRPADSKSWAPIPCSSDTCTSYVPFSLANCSTTPPAPCSYDYRYKDNSSARGVVGTDAATIALAGSNGGDKKAKLQEVVLGCTTSYDGQSFQASDGVLSLGHSNISFASRAAARFGGRFSYCLVDHLAPRNATSYLTFGPGPAEASSPSSRTPLLLDALVAPFYAVTVDAVSVAGETLDILADVWDVKKNGGAILDSGTSLTILATPAYKAVVAALSKQLAGVPRVTMDPFEYCYNWTATSTPPAVPKLEVRFAGSARLQPPTKSYVIDAAPGVKCIGLQEGVWPGVSVIGNILQQEHLWEFDLANRWLRFKESRCAH